jgi:cation diffusion facilitator family transporter
MSRGATHPDTCSSRRRAIRRVTVWGLVANLLLSALKATAGFLSGSGALLADAVHSLSDSVTDVVVIVGVRFWSSPPDEDHPYGHGKIETLVALFIGVMLAVVAVSLAWNALATFSEGHASRPGWLALGAALASVAGKEALYQWTIRVGHRERSMALTANAWHHRSDALSSVPVALAVLGTKLRPGWTFLDHVATVLVSALILKAAFDVVWPALRQLSDAGADAATRSAIREQSLAVAGVLDVHKLRTRHVGDGLAVDLHVQVDPAMTVRDGHALSHCVKDRILGGIDNVVDVLIHLEPHDPAV